MEDPARPPLVAAELRAALADHELRLSETTLSTNADAADAAREGASEGTVVTTEHQTRGRGRLDRGWDSPPGAGLTVSVVLRPAEIEPMRWVWLPLLTGLAVDATVRELGVASGLKWPNDVQVDGRKIAGILLERVETPAGPAAIVGIGLNVTLRADERPVETATSLWLEGARETDRNLVLPLLVGHLDRVYRRWRDAGGDPAAGLRDAYRERCVTLGSRVRVSRPDGSVLLGTASDIDDLGRLVVDGEAVSAGDVTHVRPATP